MICMFTHEPCKYIKCPLWSERKEACRFVLAIDKILGEAPPKVQLTPKEQKILELMTQGYSNKQISGTLNIGVSTVKNHVSRVLAKLNAKSRTEAAIRDIESKKGAKGSWVN